MRPTIRLGRIAGIEVGIHWSLLVIGVLLVGSLAGGVLPAWAPNAHGSYVAAAVLAVARFFASILGPTYPNRVYTHSAQTDRITNTTAVATMPTIWDSLATAGLDGRYYYSDLPFVALYGGKYGSISHPIADESM